jgi:hypothetical protein
MFLSQLALLLLSCLSAACLAHKTASPKKIRKICAEIFETAFVPQQYVTKKDLEMFSDLVDTKAPNYFSCPEGGIQTLTNYTKHDLMGWFLKNFNPADFKYAEYIMGDILVAGNYCSFDKLFFAVIEEECQFYAQSRLLMEVDPKHGTLVSWIDTFDEEDVATRFGNCLATGAPTETPTSSPTDSPTETPTSLPTDSPTSSPTETPTQNPTGMPTEKPTKMPTSSPTPAPVAAAPTPSPLTAAPTPEPTHRGTAPPDAPDDNSTRRVLLDVTADTVRNRCVEIFEAAFPPKSWVSDSSLIAFTKLVSTSKHNYFACPIGGNKPLKGFTPDQLLDWFATNFDPNAFKYTEYIFDDVMVAGKVCSFDKLFFAEIGGDCQLHAMSRLIIELDDQGMLLKWIDHFDEKDASERFGTCLKKVKKKEKEAEKKKKESKENKEQSNEKNKKKGHCKSSKLEMLAMARPYKTSRGLSGDPWHESPAMFIAWGTLAVACAAVALYRKRNNADFAGSRTETLLSARVPTSYGSNE